MSSVGNVPGVWRGAYWGMEDAWETMRAAAPSGKLMTDAH